jgi:hypothetical protein
MSTREEDFNKKVKESLVHLKNELKKASKIGKKMFFASRQANELKGYYEILGEKAANALFENKLIWDDPEALEILEQIREKKKDLKDIESDLKRIKKPR